MASLGQHSLYAGVSDAEMARILTDCNRFGLYFNYHLGPQEIKECRIPYMAGIGDDNGNGAPQFPLNKHARIVEYRTTVCPEYRQSRSYATC